MSPERTLASDVQSVWPAEYAIGQAGAISDLNWIRVESHPLTGDDNVVEFGRAVQRGPVAGTCIPGAAAGMYLGLSIMDPRVRGPHLEIALQNKYTVGNVVSVLYFGRMFVKTLGEVDWGQDAYVATDNGELGNEHSRVVRRIDVTDGGANFNPATTTVTVSAPMPGVAGRRNAEARAVISGGVVIDIEVTDPGFGYTQNNAPTVTITDSDAGAETAASATAVRNDVLKLNGAHYLRATSGTGLAIIEVGTGTFAS